MLVQSTADRVVLLPAIPQEFVSGSVRGLRVRGGAEVDISWENGTLTEFTVCAKAELDTKFVYRGKEIPVKLSVGETRTERAEIFLN